MTRRDKAILVALLQRYLATQTVGMLDYQFLNAWRQRLLHDFDMSPQAIEEELAAYDAAAPSSPSEQPENIQAMIDLRGRLAQKLSDSQAGLRAELRSGRVEL